MSLISEQYRKEQQRLHSAGNYGITGSKFGPVVSDMVNKTGSKTLLDYGCGRNRSLLKALDCDVQYIGYDPGVEEYSAEPPACDAVACIDVLEHIEPELLDNVLDHIRSKTLKHALLTIHTGPAVKTLSDGRNAHLIQEPPRWWLPKIWDRWELRSFVRTPDGFVVAVSVS